MNDTIKVGNVYSTKQPSYNGEYYVYDIEESKIYLKLRRHDSSLNISRFIIYDLSNLQELIETGIFEYQFYFEYNYKYGEDLKTNYVVGDWLAFDFIEGTSICYVEKKLENPDGLQLKSVKISEIKGRPATKPGSTFLPAESELCSNCHKINKPKLSDWCPCC